MMSSPNPFDYFGLSYDTASQKDLKKAYAEKLKSIRPEDDREGFMTLRRCFENARREIMWREEDAAYDAAQAQEADADVDQDRPQSDSDIKLELPPQAIQEVFTPVGHEKWRDVSNRDSGDIDPPVEDPPVEQNQPPHPVDIAMTDIAALTQSPFASGSFAPWQAILDRDELQTIDNYQIFSDRLRSFICEETGLYNDVEEPSIGPLMRFPNWLSATVLKSLGSTFGWHKQHSRQYWIRSENDWIAKLGIEYAKPGDPAERQPKPVNPGASPNTQSAHSSGGNIIKEQKRNVLVYWGWITLRIAIVAYIFYSLFGD